MNEVKSSLGDPGGGGTGGPPTATGDDPSEEIGEG